MAETENKTPKTPPFEDVKDQFQFTGFDDDQREVILGQLKQVWDTDSGRAMLQDGLNNNGLHFLNINDQNVIQTYANSRGITPDNVSTGNFARPDLGNVYLNGYDALDAKGDVQTYTGLHSGMDGQQATADTPIRSLDTNGEVFSVPPVYTLIHETNHAARGVPDIPRSRPNGIEYDQTMPNSNSEEAAKAYYGANEVDTQKILSEMGVDQHRGAYSGTAALDDVDLGADYGLGRNHDVGVTAFDGIDMTGHSSVDSVVVGATAAEVKIAAADQGVTFTDTQSRQFVSNEYKLGNSNDTVHAFDGNDVVHMGAGDDRVFLGAGDDMAHAGWGKNTIDGGDANLDPTSDHRSDDKKDWGFDTVDYTAMPTGFAAPNALQAEATFDGTARDGIYITMDGNDISVTKGQENSVRVGEDVDALHNIDAVRATSRDDLVEVTALSGDRALDGAGGSDTLRIETMPEGTTLANIVGPVTFNGTTYDGVISDGTNNLYYTDYENIVLPDAKTLGTDTGAAVIENHMGANGVNAVPPPIDASLDGAPTRTLDMKEAVRILHEEGAEAVDMERASGIESGPISTLINTPVGASVMQTLVEHGDNSLEVDASELEGDAYSRVTSVLRSSMERVEEIDKVDEVEARKAELLEQVAEVDAAVQPTQVTEAELEYEYGL